VFKEFKNYIEVIHITLEEDDAKIRPTFNNYSFNGAGSKAKH
tara:strand:- start:4844 stop:4969 length:126 start_codon:yes stop_codon:yes gene_type:complete